MSTRSALNIWLQNLNQIHPKIASTTYRHCDGYPAAMGADLCRYLRLSGRASDALAAAIPARLWDELGRQGLNIYAAAATAKPEDVWGDLEWIYHLYIFEGREVAFRVLHRPGCWEDWRLWFEGNETEFRAAVAKEARAMRMYRHRTG